MNILIIDDNKDHLQELKQMVSEITKDEIQCCTSNKTAMELIIEDQYRPDIVFMDIQLNDTNGIELAKEIFVINPHVQIIFVSGYDDYYLDVYAVEHIYFLKKPIDPEKLSTAYLKAYDKIKKIEKEVFIFHIGHQKMILPYHDILYFEKLKRKVLIYAHGQEEQISFYATMDELIKQLPDNFIRCHNSFIINIDAVMGYRHDRVKIESHYIPVSRKYKEVVHQAFYRNLETLTTSS